MPFFILMLPKFTSVRKTVTYSEENRDFEISWEEDGEYENDWSSMNELPRWWINAARACAINTNSSQHVVNALTNLKSVDLLHAPALDSDHMFTGCWSCNFCQKSDNFKVEIVRLNSPTSKVPTPRLEKWRDAVVELFKQKAKTYRLSSCRRGVDIPQRLLDKFGFNGWIVIKKRKTFTEVTTCQSITKILALYAFLNIGRKVKLSLDGQEIKKDKLLNNREAVALLLQSLEPEDLKKILEG